MRDRFFYTLAWVLTLFAAGLAGYGVGQPEPPEKPVCIVPMYDLGYDSPELRLWAYSLNEDVCFKDRMWERPETVGLTGEGNYFPAWYKQDEMR